jgi:hypothetical protein
MRNLLISSVLSVIAAAPAFAAVPVATYEFNNSFAADQTGVPALTPVDPLGESNFHSDTVLGVSRTVWNFAGSNTPADQAGFTLNTTGLLTSPSAYSVDMIFQLTDRDGAWRRLLDTQNRQSDNGFYVDPSNNLDIYPISGSTAAWTNDTYHHIVLTVDGSDVSAYLDGVSQFTTTTAEMDLDYDPTDNPDQLLTAFLDNVVAGGQGEWSAGDISFFRLWDGALSPSDAEALANNPYATPEPATLGLLAAGSLLLVRRRRV